MLEALGAIGPLFAVLAIGEIASTMAKMRAAESSLTSFVLYFALPAFLFDAVATAPVSKGVPLSFALIAFGVTAGIVVALVDVPLPTPVSDTLQLFGQTAVPLAMFAVGLTLPIAIKGLTDGSVPAFALALGATIKVILLPILTVGIVAAIAPSLKSTVVWHARPDGSNANIRDRVRLVSTGIRRPSYRLQHDRGLIHGGRGDHPAGSFVVRAVKNPRLNQYTLNRPGYTRA